MYLQTVFLLLFVAVWVLVLVEIEGNVTTEVEQKTTAAISSLSSVKDAHSKHSHSRRRNSSSKGLFKRGPCFVPFFFPLCCNGSEFWNKLSASNFCNMAESMKTILNESPHFTGRSTVKSDDKLKENHHNKIKNKENENANEEEKHKPDRNREKDFKEDDDDDGKKQQETDEDEEDNKQDDDDDEEEKETKNKDKETDEENDEDENKGDWRRRGGSLFESRNMKTDNEFVSHTKKQRFGECFLNKGGPNCLIDVTDALESNDYFVYIGPEKLNFNRSRSLCLGRNMYLAEVSTELEENLLKKVMSHKAPDTYWLGMTRDFGDRQLFYWDDGQPTNNFVNLALNIHKIVTNAAFFCVVKHVSNEKHLRFECMSQPPNSYPICMYKPGHIIPPALRNIVYAL